MREELPAIAQTCFVDFKLFTLTRMDEKKSLHKSVNKRNPLKVCECVLEGRVRHA